MPMNQGIKVLLVLTFAVLSWYLFKLSGFSYLALILFFIFNLGLLVNKYRFFVLAMDLSALTVVLFNFHVHKTTGLYLFDVIPDLFLIFLDTNTTEIKSTLADLNSALEIITILAILIIIFIAFLLRPIQYKGIKLILIIVSITALVGLAFDKSYIVQKSYSGVITTTNVYQTNIEQVKASEEFHWHAKSTYHGDDTVVLVLGETTRGDRFSLNGYHRQTNPYLTQQKLINFTDVISNATTTLVSTPIIMTRSKGELNSKIFPEKSLIAAFDEAGYETYYISYVGMSNVGENSINNMINDADYFINTTEDHEPSQDKPTDVIGLQSVFKALESPAHKKLIVYKLIGSHFNFHDRYTQEFNKFRPSHLDIPFTGSLIEEKDILNNSYDNSVLVTDYVVNKIIEKLKLLEGRTSLSYISDHGISIFDDNKSAYGGPTEFNYRIPMFFWFKDGYLNRKTLSILSGNNNTKVDSTCFLDTFLTVNNILTDKQKGCNLATEHVKPYKRIVILKNRFVDFDKYFFTY